MRAKALTPLVVLVFSLPAIAQSPTPATPASAKPSLPNGQLQQVVALFRHGVRAPLTNLNATPTPPASPTPYAKDPWPSPPAQWGATDWGYLTEQGGKLAKVLGVSYAQTYKPLFPPGAKAFLAADISQRTMATAQMLQAGLIAGGIPATAAPTPSPTPSRTPPPTPSPTPDALFHPFEAHVGKPDPRTLGLIAHAISEQAQTWIDQKFATPFGELYRVLDCAGPACLDKVKNNSAMPCPSPGKGCSDPIAWKGQFPYANTASETFLLEYANQMDVGWGRVLKDGTAQLLSMMQLHEFYFDQTQRQPYLAQIAASNLLRQICLTLNDDKVSCRRIPTGYKFAAFVGHDTNIANVAHLLNLSWTFTSGGNRGLPDNDPLPAGALVFELWKEASGSFVRIYYAAQDIQEMHDYKGGLCPAVSVPVRCGKYSNEADTCKMPLQAFKDAIAGAIGDGKFLSPCEGGPQLCQKGPAPEN